MLKRLIAALILLSACVTICISSYVVVNKLSKTLNDDLQAVLDTIEKNDIKNAHEKINICEKKWNKYKTTFDIFLDHSMLEELNVDLPSIGPLLESGSIETAKEKIEEIGLNPKHIL